MDKITINNMEIDMKDDIEGTKIEEINKIPEYTDIKLNGNDFKDSFYYAGEEVTPEEAVKFKQDAFKVPAIYFLKPKEDNIVSHNYSIRVKTYRSKYAKCPICHLNGVISYNKKKFDIGSKVYCRKCNSHWWIIKKSKRRANLASKKDEKVLHSSGRGYRAYPEDADGCWVDKFGIEHVYRKKRRR